MNKSLYSKLKLGSPLTSASNVKGVPKLLQIKMLFVFLLFKSEFLNVMISCLLRKLCTFSIDKSRRLQISCSISIGIQIRKSRSLLLQKQDWRILEHWNRQKILSNIRQQFSFQVDEGIAKIFKRKLHGGHLFLLTIKLKV